MKRKAVDIATKMHYSSTSQCHVSTLNFSKTRHCIQQTLHKLNELHAVGIKSGAGRRLKLTTR